jgi:phospholipid transport system substrate-binding protein
MRRFWVVGAVLWLVFAPSLAKAADAADLIKKLSNQAIGILSGTPQSSDERKQKLEGLLRGSMDLPFVGRFVLGRYWRQLDGSQKQAYQTAYEHYVLRLYAGQLNGYSGESFLVIGSREIDDQDTVVSSQLVRKDRASVAVDWRVRQTGDNYRVIDVSVEGVSMALTQRQEFASIVQREGVDTLIKRLGTPPRDPGPPK